MDKIKNFFDELLKTIAKSIWGYAMGIFVFYLIMIALKEIVRVFTELGYLQIAGITTGLIIVFGIIDYIGNYEYFEDFSDFIENLFSKINHL